MGKKWLSKWFPIGKRKNMKSSFEKLNEGNPEEFQKNNSTTSDKAIRNDMADDMGIDETDKENNDINNKDFRKESFNKAAPNDEKIDSNFDSSNKERNSSKPKDARNESSIEAKVATVTNKNDSNNSVAWGVFMVAAGGLHPSKYEEPLEENKWPTWNEERKINNPWPNWNSERPLDNEWPKWNKS